jgi:hypothetical protein
MLAHSIDDHTLRVVPRGRVNSGENGLTSGRSVALTETEIAY